MLADLIRVIPKSDTLEPEDIFGSSLGLIFTDDTRNQHGDPDAIVIYKSARFGDITLSVPDPKGEDERKLFAHYLWNAGIEMAERVSGSGGDSWVVAAETVLELGSGLGLGGIASGLAGANNVVISDYPAVEILDNIRDNVDENFKDRGIKKPVVVGHEWGSFEDEFARGHKGFFTRVLAADCFWMPWEHRNLSRSMLHFLSPDPEARVLLIAGFHTGRAKLALFFEVASTEGLAVDNIREMHVDGSSRAWASERDGGTEHITERKKWLVIAILKRPLTKTCDNDESPK